MSMIHNSRTNTRKSNKLTLIIAINKHTFLTAFFFPFSFSSAPACFLFFFTVFSDDDCSLDLIFLTNCFVVLLVVEVALTSFFLFFSLAVVGADEVGAVAAGAGAAVPVLMAAADVIDGAVAAVAGAADAVTTGATVTMGRVDTAGATTDCPTAGFSTAAEATGAVLDGAAGVAAASIGFSAVTAAGADAGGWGTAVAIAGAGAEGGGAPVVDGLSVFIADERELGST